MGRDEMMVVEDMQQEEHDIELQPASCGVT